MGDGPNTARSTLNSTDEVLNEGAASGTGHMWQIFPSYVMTKSLKNMFSQGRSKRKGNAGTSDDQMKCLACEDLSDIVLKKYEEFELAMQSESAESLDNQSDVGLQNKSGVMNHDEINNA